MTEATTRATRGGLLAAATLLMGSCVPWTVRPIDADAKSPAEASPVSDPAGYVNTIWAARLVPAILDSAVDARTLLNALAHSREDAQTRYGHRQANGPVYFLVKGEGRVLALDTRSRVGLALVDVPPYDGRPDVSIQVGPVLRGTSLRDATGIVRFTDFVNQLQFADVGNALNERVTKTVLSPLNLARLKARAVSFAGTLALETGAEPPLAWLVPVKLSVEDLR